jgi:hypothetical protein
MKADICFCIGFLARYPAVMQFPDFLSIRLLRDNSTFQEGASQVQQGLLGSSSLRRSAPSAVIALASASSGRCMCRIEAPSPLPRCAQLRKTVPGIGRVVVKADVAGTGGDSIFRCDLRNKFPDDLLGSRRTSELQRGGPTSWRLDSERQKRATGSFEVHKLRKFGYAIGSRLETEPDAPRQLPTFVRLP